MHNKEPRPYGRILFGKEIMIYFLVFLNRSNFHGSHQINMDVLVSETLHPKSDLGLGLDETLF